MVCERLVRDTSAKYRCLPSMTADVETEWSLFKNALLGAATEHCGLKRVGVAHDGRTRTSWWTPEVKQAVGKKKVLFKQWIANKTPETCRRYHEARREAKKVVAKAKAEAWRQFGLAMSSDYRTANKVFWSTVKRQRNRSGGTIQMLKEKQGNAIT